MTWNDLAEFAAKLTPRQRKRDVLFLESYDEGALVAVSAAEILAVDLAIPDGADGTDVVPAGDPILYG